MTLITVTYSYAHIEYSKKQEFETKSPTHKRLTSKIDRFETQTDTLC